MNLSFYLAYKFPDGVQVGDQLRIECPSCKHYKKKAFVHVDSGKSICFHCGWRAGGWRTLISLLEGIKDSASFNSWLQDNQEQIRVFSYKTSSTYVPSRKLLPQVLPLSSEPVEPGDAYCAYLEERGFSYITSEFFKMHKCTVGKYANRLIVPILEGGRLVYFYDRSIDKRESRKTLGVGTSFAAWPIKKSSVVFNLDAVSRYVSLSGGPVFIAEGVFSALSLGLDNSLATLGKSVSLEQAKKIISLGAEEYIICFDPDAHTEAEELADRLIAASTLRDISVKIRKYTAGDPNDYYVNKLDAPEDIVYDLSYKVRRNLQSNYAIR